jgi:ADP-ribose pyrophosphatase YjhB (NUDIX family)
MDLIIAIIFGVWMIAVLLGWRISQWHRWYKNAIANKKQNSCPAIFMLDFYDGPELDARLQKTKDLYFQLLENGQVAIVMLTVGKLHGEIEARSVQNKRQLHKNGLPEDAVQSYGNPGAADTFEEARLMCQYAREQCMDQHVYVVANVLQATQVFMICIRNGIFPNIELVPLHNYPAWAAGKIFQIGVTFCSVIFMTPWNEQPEETQFTPAEQKEFLRLVKKLGWKKTGKDAFEAFFSVFPLVVTELAVMRRIDGKSHILLWHRSDEHYTGWHMPGGYMLRGESMEETARRVLLKETGLQLQTAQFARYFNWLPSYAPVPNHQVCLLFVCSAEGEPSPGQFFPLDTVPGDTLSHHKEYIEYLKKHERALAG